MNEKLMELLQEPVFAKKVAASTTEEDLLALLAGQGVIVTGEELVAALQAIESTEGELGESELDAVTGGSQLSLVDGLPAGQMSEVHDMLKHMNDVASAAAKGIVAGNPAAEQGTAQKEAMDAVLGAAGALPGKPVLGL